ncbi:bifunctional 4-hydroxy-2-oxoglutarate aldolase/2-dehydro-3-deoxy-phosphogluconate aldolase [Saccharothrix luteola]|uniref:bifunctional 4-hydroxy-2-oxoglutarate aldolase/2-dehydro-3-deoxy-phosphogluconate aldolase n=1 Tax=Saccharothrix luteola TaxID=2893018 RepID=UPI001E645608|nr:bifunctional 4-hydroxy-2-oxoglutarate aldolase/2-dehydro-3-deoxy-phosphogluconate aldolase [Saccharothrix luteola]MCC8242916.1 bifunctional 4-hydroxy-2-oxoglutarate aldolase/2-dehydro-3-deoxy-phosphogluconate aldolase [Saccharothrix luteola]
MTLIEALTAHRLVAVIRGTDPAACVRTAAVLVDNGISLLEVSLTSTDALKVIERVAASGVQVGAGTVLTAADARDARDAGASFTVTPALGEGVTASVELGLPVLAGALTPSEVLAAHRAGATAVKIFPASSLGPGHITALRAPFPDIPLVPVGGIGADDVRRYLAAGALAVGVGSPLTGDAPDGGDPVDLARRVRAFVDQAVRP